MLPLASDHIHGMETPRMRGHDGGMTSMGTMTAIGGTVGTRLAALRERTLHSGAARLDGWVWPVALVSFVAHAAVGGNYGYFRDELYYIDAGRHFQAGYVDFPPFIAWLAGILGVVGDNLFVLHVVSALAAAVLIVLTARIVAELGGGRAAQVLAAVATAAAPVFSATASIFSMDVFDELWWTLGALIFLRLCRRNEPRLWVAFGVVAGIGLFTKLAMLFFGFGLVVGLLLTPRRADLRTRWPWIGGAIALAFLLPYVVWNAANGWPTPAFWRHYPGITDAGPLDFIASQILITNPFALPLVVAGLLFYLRRGEGRPYRALGWAYVVLFVVFLATHAKSYFLAPLYPMLFAAGAVVLAGSAARAARFAWALPAYIGLLALSAVVLFPGFTPTLDPSAYGGAYGVLSGSSGAKQSAEGQALPQILADRLGWEQLTAQTADVYRALPDSDRTHACIVALNYGEAGALNQLGPAHGLPRALSGHNTYAYWGPGTCDASVLVIVGYPPEDVAPYFGSVTLAATTHCPMCVPEERAVPILVARNPTVAPAAIWQAIRHFG